MSSPVALPAHGTATAATAAAHTITRKEFEADQFDAKSWINAQLRGSGAHSGTSGDSAADEGSSSLQVAHLVMRLQLMSADVQSSLQQASNELFTALPKAVRELSWLSSETGSVRLSLHSLLSDVYTIDKQQHAQVQFLSSIDAVKRRVSTVSSQLSEMDSWRRKQDHLQAVIDSRDLYRIAAELHSLQSSMHALSALPAQYTVNQQHQVRQLQDRLEELCEPALQAGLRTKDVSGVARLCAIYRQMGKEQLMQRLYSAFRREQVDAIARTYMAAPASSASRAPADIVVPSAATRPPGDTSDIEGASGESAARLQRLRALPTWLPAFYHDVVQLITEEAGWTTAIAASDTAAITFVHIAAAVAHRCSEHVSSWLTALQSAPHQQPAMDELARTQSAYVCSVEFVRSVSRVLRAQHAQPTTAQLQETDGVVRALLEPFAQLQNELPSTQKQLMLTSVEAIDVAADDNDSAVSAVHAALPVLLSSSAECVHQCLLLTGGLSAVQSLSALRSCIDELLSRLLSLMLRLRRSREKGERRARREADRPASSDDPLAGVDEEWSGLSGLFTLIAALRRIEVDGLRAAESHIRQQLLVHVVRTLAVAQRVDLERRDAQTRSGSGGGGGGSRSDELDQSMREEEDDSAEDEDDRVAIFATILRGNEANRRALEDLVEKHHQLGLRALQPTPTTSHSSRDSMRQMAAAPMFQPLDPSQVPSAPSTPATAVSPLLLLHSSFLLLLRLLTALHDDVYELLFAPLAGRLRSFSSWKQWRSSSLPSSTVVTTELNDDGSESEVNLPSFSLQPSEYAVGVGEYLLTVVQQIEPFVASSSSSQAAGDDSGHVGYVELDASYWLQRLGSGTCSLLCSSICSLSPAALQSLHTCRQLTADLDYIANVLQAINLSMEPQMVALMEALAASDEEQVKQRYSEMTSTNEQYMQAARTVLESRMKAAAVK